MINLNPTGIYNGYEYSSNGGAGITSTKEGLYVPLEDLHAFATVEANESLSTSDYRKFVWGILDSAFTKIDALPEGDRPANMTMSRSAVSFVDDDTAQRSYTVTFRYAITGFDVEDEA
jgi:hypothetical protein